MPIKLKADYAHVVIGFNNNGAPLGFRDDLHLLIKDAKTHNDTSILGMFEEVPDDADLLTEKEAAFNAKQATKNSNAATTAKPQTPPPARVSETTIITETGSETT